MKVRSGFVSNSSSQSYIIRGVEVTEEETLALVRRMGHPIVEDAELNDCLYQVFPYSSVIGTHEKRNYFDGDGETGFIIGKSIGELEDGSFIVIPEPTEEEDAVTRSELEFYGVSGELNTYVKMVSNDNY